MGVLFRAGELTERIVLAAEARVGGRTLHVLGWQGCAASRAGPNAVLLPLPVTPEVLTVEALAQSVVSLPTEAFPHVLEDMARAAWPATRIPRPAGGPPPAATVFAHGVHSVVLAPDATSLTAALDQMPLARRPALDPALLSAYAAWYPGWALVAVCFDSADAVKAPPIVLAYPPADPAHLFAPGLSCQAGGGVPDPEARVEVDITTVIAAADMEKPFRHKVKPVAYTDALPDKVRALLPDEVIAYKHRGRLPNGDWRVPVEVVRRAGDFDFWKRVMPPFIER